MKFISEEQGNKGQIFRGTVGRNREYNNLFWGEGGTGKRAHSFQENKGQPMGS